MTEDFQYQGQFVDIDHITMWDQQKKMFKWPQKWSNALIPTKQLQTLTKCLNMAILSDKKILKMPRR
jgi:hypothetical protein